MSTPLFSILTPTFNCGAKIAATAASVLSQEEGLYEFLVIDGGSTDCTLIHLGALGPRVRWISERDAGIYDAMNKGIGLSHGRFLYFLGAGDLLRPGVLRAVADCLPPTAGNLDFVYGDVLWGFAGSIYGGVFDNVRIARQNICHQAIFYGRGIFSLLGEYDLRYKACADYAMNIRCFGQTKIRKTYVDLVVADYEGGGASRDVDRTFYAEISSLVKGCLGRRIGLVAYCHHSHRLYWFRWVAHRLKRGRRRILGGVGRRLGVFRQILGGRTAR